MNKYEVVYYTLLSEDNARFVLIKADYAHIENDGVLKFYVWPLNAASAKLVASFKEWVYFRQMESGTE